MNDAAHPSFAQPSGPDATLWRYMDDWKFQWLLDNRRLYFSSADKLGDHLEGTTPQAEIDRWSSLAAAAETETQREIFRHNRRAYANASANMRNRYFVSCWNMNQFESSLMWAAYTHPNVAQGSAPLHEAVAIRTSFSLLRAALPSFVNLGTVRYIDFDAESFRGEMPNLFEWITHKEAIFRDESEVRAVAYAPPLDALGGPEFLTSYFESKDQPGTFIYAPEVNLAPLIRAVVVHPKAHDAYLERVAAQCEACGLPPPTRSRGSRAPQF